MEANKREVVKGLYKSQTWKDRVNNMSDEQVVAIYLRLKREGKIT